MTKIKLCGLSRPCDIEAANELRPEYIGSVFVPKSKRYVTAEKAAELKRLLDPNIKAVGVFVDEAVETVAALLDNGVIDAVQLHGSEDEGYLHRLRLLTDQPIIKAFRIGTETDVLAVQSCSADLVLLDSGAGTGAAFDWDLIRDIQRPYLLAGGLGLHNIADALHTLHPYGVDVSSGIETNGMKDKNKMAAFVAAVRKEDRL